MEKHCGCPACHDDNGKMGLGLPCGVHCIPTWEITMTTLVFAPTAAEAMDRVAEQMPWRMKSMGCRKVTTPELTAAPVAVPVDDRTACTHCGRGYRLESVISTYIPHNDKCPVNYHQEA